MKARTALSLIAAVFWLSNIMQAQTQTFQVTPHYTHYHRGSLSDAKTKTEGGFALMGGSTDQDAAFEWMAKKSGGGDFLVLRGSGAGGYQEYLDGLAELNSVDTIVLRDAEAAHDPFVLDKVANAEAIFLAGGDQWNYVGKWKNSPLLQQLNQAIQNGVPLGGTSAGLAVLGEHVFTAENGTIASHQALENPYHESMTFESDFLKASPLQGIITDSHFSERERMGRLVSFMSRLQIDEKQESMKGIGVDEKTAVLVESDGRCTVVGEGAAHFVKADESPEVCEKGRPLTHRALEHHSISLGQSFDLNSWTSPEVKASTLSVENGELK